MYEDTFFDELLKKALRLLRKGADAAVIALRDARREVDESEQTLKRERGDFEKAKGELDKAAAEVQRVNDALSADLACKKNCGFCTEKCSKCESGCNFDCLDCGSCAWYDLICHGCKAADATCRAARATCRALNMECWDDYASCGVRVAGCETAKGLCLGGCFIADGITTGALEIAEHAVKASKVAVDIGRGFLEAAIVAVQVAELKLIGIEKLVQMGVKVAEWLVDDLLPNLFRIKRAGFEFAANFNKNWKQSGFSFWFECVVFGETVKAHVTLNLQDLEDAANTIVDALFPGL